MPAENRSTLPGRKAKKTVNLHFGMPVIKDVLRSPLQK